MPDADNGSMFSGDNVSLDIRPHPQVPDAPASSVPGWSVLRAPTKPNDIPRTGCASRLPTQVWSSILIHLRKKHAAAQLATMALTSRQLYDIAVPILYETIIVNRHCQKRLSFGMSQILEVASDMRDGGDGVDGIEHPDRLAARHHTDPLL
jgi:hypothetical protein